MSGNIFYAYIDTFDYYDEYKTAHVIFDCITMKSADSLQNPIDYEKYKQWLQIADISIVQTIEPLPKELTKIIFEAEGGWVKIELSSTPNNAPVSLHSFLGDSIGIEGEEFYIDKCIAINTDNKFINNIETCLSTRPRTSIKMETFIRFLTSNKILNENELDDDKFTTLANLCASGENLDVTNLKELTKLYLNHAIKEARCFNVGQGNLASLIDDNGNVTAYLDFGASCLFNSNSLPPYIDRNNITNFIKEIEYNHDNPAPVILSHYDMDHYFAARFISTTSQSINGLWLLPAHCPIPKGHVFNKFLTSLKNPIFVDWGIHNTENSMGSIKIKTIHNTQQLAPGKEDRNNNSIAVSVNLRSGKKALFPADIDYSKYDIGSGYDYLVASHHGGKLNGTRQVPSPLRLQNYQLIYSAGQNNCYHHPLSGSRSSHSIAGWQYYLETWNLTVHNYYSMR